MLRHETLKIVLELDKAAYDEHAPRFPDKRWDFELTALDTAKLNYCFNIQYLGNVVPMLRAITDMVKDPRVKYKVSVDEIQHGESVVVDCLNALRDLQNQLNARPPEET